MKLPMREKYVDEATGIWIVFGTHPDGTVDINDGNRDLFTGLLPEIAEELCYRQQKFRSELYELLCAGVNS